MRNYEITKGIKTYFPCEGTYGFHLEAFDDEAANPVKWDLEFSQPFGAEYHLPRFNSRKAAMAAKARIMRKAGGRNAPAFRIIAAIQHYFPATQYFPAGALRTGNASPFERDGFSLATQ